MIHKAANGIDVQSVIRSPSVVTMGINPTKRTLHKGHYATAMNAHRALVGSRHSMGIFFIDDREHHHKLSIDSTSGTYKLPSPEAVRSVKSLLTQFLQKLDEANGTNVMARSSVMPMSEYMELSTDRNGSNGKKLYDLLWENREAITKRFNFEPMNEMPFVQPLCADCETGVLVEQNVSCTSDQVRAKCLNTLCENEDIVIRPSKDNHWSMHYAIDPLRDALLSDQFHRNVLHVFGGDYGLPWGRGGGSKADRLSTTQSELRPGKIDYYVGPLLTQDGVKLAKSAGHSSGMPDPGYLWSLLKEPRESIEVTA